MLQAQQSNVKTIKKNGKIPKGFIMLSEYARRIDVDRAEVSRALNVKKAFVGVKKGRNVFVDEKAADKHFGFKPARPATRSIKPNVKGQKSKKGKEGNTVDPGDLEDIDYNSPPSESESTPVLNKRIEYERARKLKLENDLAEKKTVPRQPVIDHCFEVGRKIRDSLNSLSTRIYPRLDPEIQEKVKKLIDEEVRKTLIILADEIVD